MLPSDSFFLHSLPLSGAVLPSRAMKMLAEVTDIIEDNNETTPRAVLSILTPKLHFVIEKKT